MPKERTTKERATKERHTYLVYGATRQGRPDLVLKCYQTFPSGTLVLVKMPDDRKEVFRLSGSPFTFQSDPGGLPQVLRRANLREVSTHEKRLELEDKGKALCLQFSKELGLDMNLVDVECYFDRTKIIFYYTAEGRIDFRELVKQLARALRMRVEMRQIGVRNETGLLGGVGFCGREFCCSRFLKQFQPLTIKMAKEQGLILDPNKISGPCGRLLCCLAYEETWYREYLRELPRLGSKIASHNETFRVLKYNFFLRVAILEREDGTIVNISIDELKNFSLKSEQEEESEEEGLRNE